MDAAKQRSVVVHYSSAHLHCKYGITPLTGRGSAFILIVITRSDHLTGDNERVITIKLTSIQKQRVYQSVIEQIKHSAANGELKPGDKLPSERELAEGLAVSRAAVREAMTVLEASRLVKVMPGVGIFLEEDPNREWMLRMNDLAVIGHQDLFHMLEMRQAVESEAAYWAALRRTSEDEAVLKGLYEQLHSAVERGELAAEEDYQFHLAIMNMAYNPYLLETMKYFSERYKDGLKQSRQESLHTPGKAVRVVEEHWRIYDGIAQQNGTEAKEAMWQHLQQVKVRYNHSN